MKKKLNEKKTHLATRIEARNEVLVRVKGCNHLVGIIHNNAGGQFISPKHHAVKSVK